VQSSAVKGRGFSLSGLGVNHIHKVGEAICDDQLGHAQTRGVGSAAHLLHQVRRVAFVFGHTRLGQGQHLRSIHPQAAGPARAARQRHPLQGVAADVVPVGQPVRVAHGVGAADEFEEAESVHHSFLSRQLIEGVKG
jgi:hypothetical protein